MTSDITYSRFTHRPTTSPSKTAPLPQSSTSAPLSPTATKTDQTAKGVLPLSSNSAFTPIHPATAQPGPSPSVQPPLYLQIEAVPSTGNKIKGEVTWNGEVYEFETSHMALQDKDLLKATIQELLPRLAAEAKQQKIGAIWSGMPELKLHFGTDGVRAHNPHETGDAKAIVLKDSDIQELSQAVRQGAEGAVDASLKKINHLYTPKSLPSFTPIENKDPVASIPTLPKLRNFDNNCYLDSFAWTYLLSDPEETKKKLETVVSNTKEDTKRKAAQGFIAFIDAAQKAQQEGTEVPQDAVKQLKAAVHLIVPAIQEKDTRQHDASEIVQAFLDLIADSTQPKIQELTKRFDASKKVISEENVRCVGNIALAIPQDTPTLETALQQYFSPTHITPYASNNKQIVQEKTQLSDFPEEISFSFKRFTNTRGKIQTEVQIPSVLNMPKEYIQNANEDTQYELVDALIHHGASIHNGHYTALVRKADDQKKMHNLYCDDASASVQEMSQEDAEKMIQHAYILRYRKIPKGQQPYDSAHSKASAVASAPTAPSKPAASSSTPASTAPTPSPASSSSPAAPTAPAATAPIDPNGTITVVAADSTDPTES